MPVQTVNFLKFFKRSENKEKTHKKRSATWDQTMDHVSMDLIFPTFLVLSQGMEIFSRQVVPHRGSSRARKLLFGNSSFWRISSQEVADTVDHLQPSDGALQDRRIARAEIYNVQSQMFHHTIQVKLKQQHGYAGPNDTYKYASAYY